MTDLPIAPLDVEGWSCPVPLRHTDRIVLGHGGGGVLSGELIEHLFLPALGDETNAEMRDSAVLGLPCGGRLAFTTDSYVVSPLFFPGGCIGDLAVNGTVNDLAMSGAQPLALSAAFILEEGLETATLGRVAQALGDAARAAGVRIVTGDTKVVDRGKADQLFINTAGVGLVPDGVDIRPDRATPGDVVLVSGLIGEHGVAIMSLREGIEFGTTLTSDTAPLHGLVADLLAAVPDVHVLRDPTRGGVAGSLSEIAEVAGAGIEVEESALPVPEAVAAACGFLGLDPMHVANEGKLVAIVPGEHADAALAALRAHPLGAQAAVIGTVTDQHPGILVARSPLGAGRVVSRPMGEQLPRIC
ncbi:hydrogenase expression/formation protein HypE [Cellulomonas denverensis]|uniref:Hydrogenase expression/formation protein HypE n=1 Tax=Cellulomonas denverensis TaxID=264297 RepID=A0A7X6KX15_9CELL|nr:hydrogenase expression/formation protein HypE [Cellulomonas denverensis]NKY23465.1 hydrogenase expression/formation protein HypE [Cellulomonas denverensis]GIG25053.1 hydrogenase expression/formation protein HypE [Cellulomonas denverensis]